MGKYDDWQLGIEFSKKFDDSVKNKIIKEICDLEYLMPSGLEEYIAESFDAIYQEQGDIVIRGIEEEDGVPRFAVAICASSMLEEGNYKEESLVKEFEMEHTFVRYVEYGSKDRRDSLVMTLKSIIDKLEKLECYD